MASNKVTTDLLELFAETFVRRKNMELKYPTLVLHAPNTLDHGHVLINAKNLATSMQQNVNVIFDVPLFEDVPYEGRTGENRREEQWFEIVHHITISGPGQLATVSTVELRRRQPF
jgi:hypothetical protein